MKKFLRVASKVLAAAWFLSLIWTVSAGPFNLEEFKFREKIMGGLFLLTAILIRISEEEAEPTTQAAC